MYFQVGEAGSVIIKNVARFFSFCGSLIVSCDDMAILDAAVPSNERSVYASHQLKGTIATYQHNRSSTKP